MFEMTLPSLTLAQTQQSAADLATRLNQPMRLFLSGDLGAGKTSWVRALLRAAGETGIIPSPSFALAHTYHLRRFTAHHVDCFRLQGETIGDDLLELLNDNALCLVEWPEQAKGLPPPDVRLYFDFAGDSQRNIRFVANTRAALKTVCPSAI